MNLFYLFLGCTIILGLILQLILLDDHLPTELVTLPIIGAYMFFVLLMTTVGILISMVILNCVSRGNKVKKVPTIIRNVSIF